MRLMSIDRLVVLFGAVALLAAAQPAVAPASGDADAWWTTSTLDADGDRVDDALESVMRANAAATRLRVLVGFAASPTPQQVAAVEDAGGAVVARIRVVPVLVVDAAPEAVERLARAPGVVLVEEDRALRPVLDESRGLVRADEAQRVHGVTGAGVSIAVLDTGVDTTHPDLGNRVVASHDATLPPLIPRTLLGVQAPSAPEAVDGHGTHVAGIAAGPGTASDGRYAGVAPDAGIVNVRVFDAAGEASSSDVLSGIDWVVANKERLRTRVMVMSLGGAPTDGTDALSRAVNVAADLGLLTVAAAGNDGPGHGSVGIPGVAARALTVGAVDKEGAVARFSARGPTVDGRSKPDVVAPGVEITSTLPRTTARGGAYGPLSGTSMAAPHVAGAAALVFEANGSLTPAEAKWVLVATSLPTGPTPRTWHAAYGWGHLDAEAAVRAAMEPEVLGTAPFEETARAVPFDGESSPLEKLDYEAGRVRRSLPAPPSAVAATALAVVALALAAPGRPGR